MLSIPAYHNIIHSVVFITKYVKTDGKEIIHIQYIKVIKYITTVV